MAIQIPPIVVAPQPEKTADKLWILTMNINANSGNSAPTTAYFSVAPYISSTGEILRDQMQHINVPDVFTACYTNPILAQAVGAIYLSVESLCKERYLFGMQPDPITPVITVNPVNVTVLSTATVTFSVTAKGRPLNYQWQKDGVNIVNGENISGATLSLLVLTNVAVADSGEYTVIVSNILNSVTSTSATLTVTVPELTIDTQPANQSVLTHTDITFTVIPAPGRYPFSYQWKKDGVDLIDSGSISGVTTNTLTILNGLEVDSGTYLVIVTNSDGTITSNNAVLTVSIPEVTIDSQPVDQTVNERESAKFTVVPTPGRYPFTYQWSKDGVDIIDGENAASDTLIISNASETDAGTYVVVVTNLDGTVTSDKAILTVNVPPQ